MLIQWPLRAACLVSLLRDIQTVNFLPGVVIFTACMLFISNGAVIRAKNQDTMTSGKTANQKPAININAEKTISILYTVVLTTEVNAIMLLTSTFTESFSAYT